MRKIENYTLNLCLLYIIFVFTYGIVIKFTINNNILFQLKTYFPEFILVVVAALSFIKDSTKYRLYSFALIAYSLAIFIVHANIHGMTEQGLYCIRDIFIPMLSFCFLIRIKLTENELRKFLSRLVVFLKIYLFAGLALAVIQQVMGWEWSSAFYTGYSFYGQDPISKVKMAHNLGLLRAPSLSGNFATFGYYCLIADVIIAANTNKVWKKVFWDCVAMLCMILATNKSAALAFAVIIFLRITSINRKKSKRINRMFITLIVLILVVSTFMLIGDNNGVFTSVFARFEVWKELLISVNITELLIPYNMFIYGSGAEGSFGFWDNTYLYFLFTQGIIGTGLWINIIVKTYKAQIRENSILSQKYIYELTLALLILGLTTNVTQGRGFLAPYLVILGVGNITYNCNTLLEAESK